MWALQAKAHRADRLFDSREAAIAPHLERNSAEQQVSQMLILRAGPAKFTTWQDNLTPVQREELTQVDREVEETMARLRRRGCLAAGEQPMVQDAPELAGRFETNQQPSPIRGGIAGV